MACFFSTQSLLYLSILRGDLKHLKDQRTHLPSRTCFSFVIADNFHSRLYITPPGYWWRRRRGRAGRPPWILPRGVGQCSAVCHDRAAGRAALLALALALGLVRVLAGRMVVGRGSGGFCLHSSLLLLACSTAHHGQFKA